MRDNHEGGQYRPPSYPHWTQAFLRNLPLPAALVGIWWLSATVTELTVQVSTLADKVDAVAETQSDLPERVTVLEVIVDELLRRQERNSKSDSTGEQHASNLFQLPIFKETHTE